MKLLIVLWIVVAIGFLIGRWNRGNDCNVTISLGDAIRWIEAHGESRTEKAHEEDKAEIYRLPNFDAEKFEECVGVKVKRGEQDDR